MELVIEDNAVEHDYCKDCQQVLRQRKYRMIGLCRQCYREKFPPSEIDLPPLRRKVKGGWQRLFSPEERLRWQRPFDEVIERIDRENEGKPRRSSGSKTL